MDISGSVGGHWADEKSFVMDLVRTFDLFSNGAHAAVTTFDNKASLGIKFQDHTTNDDFESALDTLLFTGGNTEIGIALDVALNEMFQEVNGMRLDSPKVAVLITDGDSNSAVDYAGFRNLFRGAHIKLLVVGIGNVNENALLELVETPEDLLLVTDFAALDVTDFVEHTTFCEPDACACKYNLKYRIGQCENNHIVYLLYLRILFSFFIKLKSVRIMGTKIQNLWIIYNDQINLQAKHLVSNNIRLSNSSLYLK